MIVTKSYLDRRTILRGLGASLALPLLDAMVPAFASRTLSAAAAVKRLSIVYVPMGAFMKKWTPPSKGRSSSPKFCSRSRRSAIALW
jgi:hypothetical protein